MIICRVLLFCVLVAFTKAQGIESLIGGTVTGREIIGGEGAFPVHGGAGAGQSFSDGLRNGWDGNPNSRPGMRSPVVQPIDQSFSGPFRPDPVQFGGGRHMGEFPMGGGGHSHGGAGPLGPDPMSFGGGQMGRMPEFLDPVTGNGVHVGGGSQMFPPGGPGFPKQGHDIYGGRKAPLKKNPVIPKKPVFPKKKPALPHKPMHKPVYPQKPMHKPKRPILPKKPIHKPILPKFHKKPIHKPVLPKFHKKPIHKPVLPKFPKKPIHKPVLPKFPHKSILSHKPVHRLVSIRRMAPRAHNPFGHNIYDSKKMLPKKPMLYNSKRKVMPHKPLRKRTFGGY